MCTVSFVADEWARRFPENHHWPQPDVTNITFPQSVTMQEFDDLKKEVEALKELLKAAKKFDEETGQPDCEMEEKIAFIKKIADAVDVDLSEVFGK